MLSEQVLLGQQAINVFNALVHFDPVPMSVRLPFTLDVFDSISVIVLYCDESVGLLSLLRRVKRRVTIA